MKIPDEIKQRVAYLIGSHALIPIPLVGLLLTAAEALVNELMEDEAKALPTRKARMVDISDIKDSLLARDVLKKAFPPPSEKTTKLLRVLHESFQFLGDTGHFDLDKLPSNLSAKLESVGLTQKGAG